LQSDAAQAGNGDNGENGENGGFLDTFRELCDGRRLAVGVLRERRVGLQGVEKGGWGSNVEMHNYHQWYILVHQQYILVCTGMY
jgi:hypothetical protein